MNDTIFDQKITAAFAALPPADVYLKNRLLRLPEERQSPAPRRITARRLVPLAAALAVVVVAGAVALQWGSKMGEPADYAAETHTDCTNEPGELPLLPYGGFFNETGGQGAGDETVWVKSAAELHRDSPAYGREGEIGSLPVYRNPEPGKKLSEAEAMEIAVKFGRAVGKTYIYELPHWLTPEGQEQVREKLRSVGDSEEEIEAMISEQFGAPDFWRFKCGEETLMVNARGGVSIEWPVDPPVYDGSAARHEQACLQAYEPYAAAIETLTGLRFSKASTACSYNIYGAKYFETFLYVNNPGDPLAKQMEDYALNRLTVYVEQDPNPGEPFDALALNSLYFDLHPFGAEDLLGSYPVMDLEGAKKALLAGRWEAMLSSAVTPEMLARATIGEAELIYMQRPWLSTAMPVYRFYLRFDPDDLEEPIPALSELGLQEYYVFYVPAVPAEYFTPQETEGSMLVSPGR